MAFEFPKQKLVFGPRQVVARINQDQVIAPQITLWNQQGSEVIQGTLMVIPIEESLLYVRPMYLRAQAGRIPELTRVIVAYQNSIVMERTLDAGLARLFSPEAVAARKAQPKDRRRGATAEAPAPRTAGSAPAPAATPSPPTGEPRRPAPAAAEPPCRPATLPPRRRPPTSGRIAAQRAGDWATYGAEITRLGQILDRLAPRAVARRATVAARPSGPPARGRTEVLPYVLQNTARAAGDVFGGEREPRLDAGAPGQQVGHVRADGGAVLEAVTRAAADDPHAGPVGCTSIRKSPVEVFSVLADARIDERRAAPSPGSGGPGSRGPARRRSASTIRSAVSGSIGGPCRSTPTLKPCASRSGMP